MATEMDAHSSAAGHMINSYDWMGDHVMEISTKCLNSLNDTTYVTMEGKIFRNCSLFASRTDLDAQFNSTTRQFSQTNK